MKRPYKKRYKSLNIGGCNVWWLLLLPLHVFAQNDLDLTPIHKLADDLPAYEIQDNPERDLSENRPTGRYRPPRKIHYLKEIQTSGTETGSIREGLIIIDINTNKTFRLSKQIYVTYYKLEDEFGFKYIQNKDGTCRFKIKNDFLADISEEKKLYEPPRQYTPAPENIVHTEYDKKLKWAMEGSFYAGITQGDYMKDLFNDSKASQGISTQFGAHLLADWKTPIKVGAVLHFERTEYQLSQKGSVIYSSLSFGPQFKSKDFYIGDISFRLQTQFRVSPYAKAVAQTQYGNAEFKFNSADSLSSLEFPIQNKWGEFVISIYGQYQWLSIKEQNEELDLKASNQSNKSFGLALSQVF